ncbi:MAG: hypothetical protein RSE12_03435 [Fuscovulum sp.]|nr:MAG: hypothetical protein RSE12_03435 [Fuscovulum sp.]
MTSKLVAIPVSSRLLCRQEQQAGDIAALLFTNEGRFGICSLPGLHLNGYATGLSWSAYRSLTAANSMRLGEGLEFFGLDCPLLPALAPITRQKRRKHSNGTAGNHLWAIPALRMMLTAFFRAFDKLEGPRLRGS